MKVHFILKGTNSPTKIICRFKPTQTNDFTNTLDVAINRNDWNAQKQQIKQKATTTNKDLINSKLKELEGVILDKWVNDSLHKKNISKNWLKEIINTFFGKAANEEQYKVYFVDWISKFIEEAPKRLHKGKSISYKTIQQYAVTQKKIIDFENLKNIKIRFENIDLNFHRDFIHYCKEVEKLGDNSIGGHIKNIKMWCKNIELEGYKINQQYKHSSFTAVQNETIDTYLNEAEINKIFEFDFKDNVRLSNTKDLFIIGLRTGLRVSDFMRVGVLNIKDEKISIETMKTKQKVVIPMHPQIKQILENRNGVLPHAISPQKFNDYIKEICALAGINEQIEGAKMNPETNRKESGYFPKWELITSHTCRRSFATNLYGKLPNKVIMAITGHTTETQFLKYIKTTNDEFAEILGDFWNSENGSKR